MKKTPLVSIWVKKYIFCYFVAANCENIDTTGSLQVKAVMSSNAQFTPQLVSAIDTICDPPREKGHQHQIFKIDVFQLIR